MGALAGSESGRSLAFAPGSTFPIRRPLCLRQPLEVDLQVGRVFENCLIIVDHQKEQTQTHFWLDPFITRLSGFTRDGIPEQRREFGNERVPVRLCAIQRIRGVHVHLNEPVGWDWNGAQYSSGS
jgi:hypothetical protein